MTRYIQASEFKAKCLSVMEKVRRTKRGVIITKRNVPIAELIPLHQKHTSLFGCMKNSVTFLGDMTQPIDEEWDANR